MAVDFNNTEVAFKHKTNSDLRFAQLIFKLMGIPIMTGAMTKLTLLALKINLPISWVVKLTIFKQFCGGTSITDSEATYKLLSANGIEAILDYSVEGQEEEKSFDHVKNELIRLIENAKAHSKVPTTCLKITGLARFGLLQKVSENKELTQAEKLEYSKVIERLNSVCEKAHEIDVKIYIDAEESWVQVAIDRLAEVMIKKYNGEKAIVYTTLQLCRRDKLSYLKDLIKRAKTENFILGVKLVRGAYVEKENERAIKLNYTSPIQPNKDATDRDYNLALTEVVENISVVELCAGSHNEESAAHLVALLEKNNYDINHTHIFFSQLYGMSDNISFNLAKSGYNVSKYLPYGPVKDTLPYLIRRARENTSVAGQMGKELQLINQEIERRKKII
ncbi:MAG: proline dehydrogenase family protein [Flavobacteriales bacterium]